VASLQKRKIKGNYYWYIVESKRINGKPTPVVVAYLGTVENMLSKFAASNSNNASYRSYSHGAVYALWKTAEKYGIIDAINSVAGNKSKLGISSGEAFVLASIYRYICNDENIDFIEWVQNTTLPLITKFNTEKLTNDFIWKIAESITEEQMSKIEDVAASQILNYYKQEQPFSFVYGCYFNFITESYENAKKIKQKNNLGLIGSNLNQYNLEIIMERNIPFPISAKVEKNTLYSIKPQPDISEEILKKFNVENNEKKLTIVFDRIGNAQDNIKQIEESGLNYICAVSLNNAKDLVNIPLDKYENITVNGKTILYIKSQKNLFSMKHVCIIYFNQKQKESQIKRLNKDINEKIEKLEVLREQLKNKKISNKRADVESRIKSILAGGNSEDLFNVTLVGKRVINDIQYQLNEKVYEEICNKFFGKKLLITNHEDWSAAEIIQSYISQSEMERMFKYSMKLWNLPMKNDFIWTDLKIRVHVFCCLLGYTLCGLLQKELSNAGFNSDMDSIINKLKNIRETTVIREDPSKKSGYAVERVIEKMTDEQKLLWDKVLEIFNTEKEEECTVLG